MVMRGAQSRNRGGGGFGDEIVPSISEMSAAKATLWQVREEISAGKEGGLKKDVEEKDGVAEDA